MSFQDVLNYHLREKIFCDKHNSPLVLVCAECEKETENANKFRSENIAHQKVIKRWMQENARLRDEVEQLLRIQDDIKKALEGE